MLNYKNQPYLFKDQQNQEILLYCHVEEKKTLYFGQQYDIMPWKIKLDINANSIRPNLPQNHSNLGEIVIECNPHVVIKNNLPQFYYIAGFCKGDNFPIMYFLCSTTTNWEFTEFTEFKIIERCFSGAYIGNDLYYTKKTRDGDCLVKNAEDLGVCDPFKFIYRICPVYDQSNKMIITGETLNGPSSILVDVATGEKQEIKNSLNQNIYKCTILDNKLVYTKKIEGSEERYLIEEYLNN